MIFQNQPKSLKKTVVTGDVLVYNDKQRVTPFGRRDERSGAILKR